MENEKNFDKNGVYSKRVRAGKRRTYFFDVRTTRANDYYLTITESKKRFEDDNYDRHKIFIYKEDFVKFVNAMQETVDYIKTELLPDYDFDAHNHDEYEEKEYKSDSSYKSENTDTETDTDTKTPEAEKSDIETSFDTDTEVEKQTPPPTSTITPPAVDDDSEKWD